MPFLFRRTAETFLASILCSAPIMAFIMIGIIPSTKSSVLLVSVLSAVAFLFLNVVRLRSYIFSLKDYNAYFLVNGLVFGLYALLSTGLILCRQGVILAWMFFPVKVIETLGAKTILSAAFVYLLLFGSILAVAREYAGMARIRQEEEADPVEM